MFMTLEESKSKTVIGGLCRRIFWSLTINIPTSQPGMERENKRRSSHWRSDPPELASIALPRHCSTNGHQKRGKCWLSHLFQKSLVTSTPLSGTTKAPCVSTRHRSENVTEFQAILQADHLTTVPCFSPPENSSCWSRIGRRWCCCGTRPGSPGSEPTSQRKPVWSTAFCLLDQRFLSENQKSSNCGGNWCPNEEPFGASSSLSGNPLGLAHLHRRSAGFGELHIAGDSDIHKKGPEMNKENLPFTRTQVISPSVPWMDQAISLPVSPHGPSQKDRDLRQSARRCNVRRRVPLVPHQAMIWLLCLSHGKVKWVSNFHYSRCVYIVYTISML